MTRKHKIAIGLGTLAVILGVLCVSWRVAVSDVRRQLASGRYGDAIAITDSVGLSFRHLLRFDFQLISSSRLSYSRASWTLRPWRGVTFERL